MYTQQPYRCRLDWGRHGTREAAAGGDILVIVDTLSFSSAAVTAVHHGGIIYPCSWEDEDPEEFARHIGGIAAVNRLDVPEKGRFSLSPPTFLQIQPGERVVLASPNGATCSRYAGQVPHLLVGTLLNAQATANAVASLLAHSSLNVTVIACGERWKTPTADGELRIAIEDYLGAGAILSALPYDQSPEARVCAGAFMQTRDDLAAIIWDCGSGRELRQKGYSIDVTHSAQLNVYDTAPIMEGDHLVPFTQGK